MAFVEVAGFLLLFSLSQWANSLCGELMDSIRERTGAVRGEWSLP